MSRQFFDQHSEPFTPIEPGDTAGGDLTGTYPDPTVAKIKGVAIADAAAVGEALVATGALSAEWLAPGGDLSGSFPNPSVVKLQGAVALSGAASSEAVLTATGAATATWLPPAENMLSFDDLTALRAFDDSRLDAGALAYVQTLRSYFQKQLVAPAPAPPAGDVTVVPTQSGDGGWYRLAVQSPTWQSEGSWYINPAGSDENSGTATDKPLKTFAEFNRRLTTIVIPTTVTLQADTTEHLVGTFNTTAAALDSAYLIIKGTPTVLASGLGTFTAHVAGTNSRNTVAIAGVANFGPYVGYFLRAPEADALTGPYINTILKSAGASAYTGFWCRRDLTTTPPAGGVDYDIIRLTSVGSFQINAQNLIARVYYLETEAGTINKRSFLTNISSRGNTAIIGNARVFGCKFKNAFVHNVDTGFLGGCTWAAGFANYNFGYVANLYGCNSYLADMTLSWTGQWFLADCTIQGGRLLVGQIKSSTGNVVVELTGSVGVFDAAGASTGAVAVERTSTLAGAQNLYGDGNAGWGLTVKNGGRVFMTSSSTVPTITGSPGQEVRINDSDTANPALPSAGGAVPAAATLKTWAQWAGGTFNKYAFSYLDWSSITLTI